MAHMSGQSALRLISSTISADAPVRSRKRVTAPSLSPPAINRSRSLWQSRHAGRRPCTAPRRRRAYASERPAQRPPKPARHPTTIRKRAVFHRWQRRPPASPPPRVDRERATVTAVPPASAPVVRIHREVRRQLCSQGIEPSAVAERSGDQDHCWSGTGAFVCDGRTVAGLHYRRGLLCLHVDLLRSGQCLPD